uniref:Major capsid protein N-terminal domain-containing protein n=1 Tax=viral metagenome TaxID=1070528 RepID=A0A6C0J1A4_9ZZZZ
MAGELQLMSSGPQEKFFTLDPDYSHFLESFKKHTNFSNEYVDLDPENEADFGSTVKFKIPQNQGDLLKTLSLKVTLPSITTSGVCYQESAGHALIEHVDLIIGGKVIQRLTSDWLQIYSEHFVTQTKQIALEELIGKFPERTAHRRVSNRLIVARNALGNTQDISFFVDLPFYFYNHPELAIPLCAINRQEVEVEFKLRTAQEIVIQTNGNKADISQETPKIKDFQLCAEVVHVDCEERIKMQKSRRDYLITQIQQNVFDVGLGLNTGQFKLDFVNPVKELYFVIQRQGSVGTDEFEFVTPFDYDGILEETGNKYILWENLDHLTLTLDGQEIITKDTGTMTFLKAVQAAIHHSKTQLIRRFYSYSFALQPEEWYPTGQVNFSLVKEQILNLSLNPCTGYSRQVRVYAVNYNILRVGEGTAKTIFDLKY